MGAFKRIKKDLATELAWKELKEALKPLNRSSLNRSASAKQQMLKHPTVITTSEFCRWELFG